MIQIRKSSIGFKSIAFPYNAKGFALAFLAFFFLFLLPSAAFWTDWQKFFRKYFFIFLPGKRVTKIGPVSLNTLAHISLVICLLLLQMDVTHDVPCTLERLVMAKVRKIDVFYDLNVVNVLLFKLTLFQGNQHL